MINITLSLFPDMTFLGVPYNTNDKICRIIWADIPSLITVTGLPQSAVHLQRGGSLCERQNRIFSASGVRRSNKTQESQAFVCGMSFPNHNKQFPERFLKQKATILLVSMGPPQMQSRSEKEKPASRAFNVYMLRNLQNDL